MTTRVRDAKGRQWSVGLRFSPWRRVVRPMAYMLGRNPRRELSTPPAAPPERKKSTADRVVEVLAAPIVYSEAIGPAIVWLLASPLIAAELVALGAGGAGLAVARALGMARYRVEVVAHTGFLLHSETALLVRGRARAGELVARLAEDRAGAGSSFHPDGLPADVTVRAHRSIWQSSAEWVAG
ncbi:hypothetical protein [Actinophytocola sp. KF-1]